MHSRTLGGRGIRGKSLDGAKGRGKRWLKVNHLKVVKSFGYTSDCIHTVPFSVCLNGISLFVCRVELIGVREIKMRNPREPSFVA